MLSRFKIATLCGCLCLITGTLLAQDPQEKNPKWKLRVDLVDGSRVIGTTTNTAIKLDVGFDELSIPLERIRRVEQGEKPKTVKIELNNRDIYTGKLIAEPLNLTTIFGPVKLTMSQIVTLEVIPADLMGWLPTQQGLVLYYPLDDGENATNHAGDKHHGKSQRVKWVEKGLREGSLEFDGTGGTVIAHHQDLCPQKLTLAAWIYPIGESSSYQMVMVKTGAGSWAPGYGLVRTSGDSKHLNFFVNNYYNTTVKGEIPHDKWSHVAGVFDGETLWFYLNGKEVDKKNLKALNLLPTGNQPALTHTTTPLVLGSGDQNGTYGWKGKLDEVVFFNRALDAHDIRRLYESIPRSLIESGDPRTRALN